MSIYGCECVCKFAKYDHKFLSKRKMFIMLLNVYLNSLTHLREKNNKICDAFDIAYYDGQDNDEYRYSGRAHGTTLNQ